jgi:hypothetical protein
VPKKSAFAARKPGDLLPSLRCPPNREPSKSIAPTPIALLAGGLPLRAPQHCGCPILRVFCEGRYSQWSACQRCVCVSSVRRPLPLDLNRAHFSRGTMLSHPSQNTRRMGHGDSVASLMVGHPPTPWELRTPGNRIVAQRPKRLSVATRQGISSAVTLCRAEKGRFCNAISATFRPGPYSGSPTYC